MQKNYLANKDFLNYLSFLMIECSKNFFGYIKMPFVVHKAFKEKGDFDKAKIAFNPLNFNQDEYNLASELAYIATLTFQRKRIGRKISLPYEAFRIKYNYKKYRFKDDLA